MRHLLSISNNDKKTLWTPVLLLTCFGSTIGTGVCLGYNLGVVNAPARFIKSWCNETLIRNYDTQLSADEIDVLWASFVSAFLIGGMVGSFFSGWCANKYGRKGTLAISVYLQTTSGLLFFFSHIVPSVEMLLIGRILAGISAALVFTAHPMYLLEIAPKELRGTTAILMGVGVVCGIFISQLISLDFVLGNQQYWHLALSFHLIFVLIFFLFMYWYPESPRWLYLVKRDVKSAQAELERLRGANSSEIVQLEIQDMENSSQFNTEKMSTWNVIRNSELTLPLVIVCVFQITQQLSGINAIFFYSVTIFAKAGFSFETAQWLNVGVGLLNLFAGFSPIYLMKFNRRPLMMLSCSMCALSLFCLAFSLNFINAAEWLPIVCILFMCLYLIFYNFGIGPIPIFIGSELFEVHSRSVAMSMGSLASWVGNFMIGMFFPIMQNGIGAFSFIPCCCICVLCLLLTYQYLPESRGRDPTELKVLMQNGFKSKINNLNQQQRNPET